MVLWRWRRRNAPINLGVTWQLWNTLESLAETPMYRMIEDQARFLLGPLKGYAPDLNDFVTPQLAAHAYDYLGLLWLFTGLTILGALVPLYKYIPEEELLYPEYEFEEEPAPAPAPAPSPAPAGMGDAMGMMAQGDGSVDGAVTDYVPADVNEGDDQADYDFYDYQSNGGQANQNYDYQFGGGATFLQAGQSYDYYNYGGRDLAGAKKRKDNIGYPPPHHLWRHVVGQQDQRGHAPSRR